MNATNETNIRKQTPLSCRWKTIHLGRSVRLNKQLKREYTWNKWYSGWNGKYARLHCTLPWASVTYITLTRTHKKGLHWQGMQITDSASTLHVRFTHFTVQNISCSFTLCVRISVSHHRHLFCVNAPSQRSCCFFSCCIFAHHSTDTSLSRTCLQLVSILIQLNVSQYWALTINFIIRHCPNVSCHYSNIN